MPKQNMAIIRQQIRENEEMEFFLNGDDDSLHVYDERKVATVIDDISGELWECDSPLEVKV